MDGETPKVDVKEFSFTADCQQQRKFTRQRWQLLQDDDVLIMHGNVQLSRSVTTYNVSERSNKRIE